jgi:hypothetical protein
MKTLKSILFFIAGACLIVACSKDEPSEPGADIQNDALVCGKVFKVQPTKGTDITAALKQAFDDAIDAGPGSVVQLPEGEFELGFIEIHEFYGSFTGAGKGKTVITVKAGIDCDGLNNQNLYGWLISFVGGDISMSDMTLKYPKGTLVCNDAHGLGAGLVIFADYNTYYTSINHYIKASVNNVEFFGDMLGPWDYHCWNGLAAGQDDMIWGINRSHADIKITNCTFDSFGWGVQMIGIIDGKLTLGTKGNGNTITNCAESVAFTNNINVNFEVVGNKFSVPVWSYGLVLNNSPWFFGDEPQTKIPLYTVEGNTFNLIGANSGVWMHDHRLVSNPDENLPVIFQARNNEFNMSNDPLTSTDVFSGIAMYEVKGSVLRNNKFTGTSEFGIFAAPQDNPFEVWAEDGLILGNNFSTANCTISAILFSELTKNWTVVGVGKKSSVINAGTNNIITGMNVKTSTVPVGQNISDRLKNMKQ